MKIRNEATKRKETKEYVWRKDSYEKANSK